MHNNREKQGKDIACQCGHTEVAGILIARGAVVDYQDKVRQL